MVAKPAKKSTAPTPAADKPSDSTDSTTSTTSSKSAKVGDVVTYQLDEAAPAQGLVVGQVDAGEKRDAQLLVVPLGDAVAVPHDAVKG